MIKIEMEKKERDYRFLRLQIETQKGLTIVTNGAEKDKIDSSKRTIK